MKIGPRMGFLMEDGTEIIICQPEENLPMKLETIIQYDGDKIKVLGMSMVAEWTPRERWGEIALRYLEAKS